MGLGGVEGPPKKKLKQAQLNFCVSTEKASNKRKLSDQSDGLALKLLRTDPGTPKTPVAQKALVFNKENVANGIDKAKDDAQKKAEPKNDEVVVLDDDSKDGKPECGTTQDKAIKETPTEENVIKIDDDVNQGSKRKDDGDRKSETEPTKTEPAADKTEAPKSTEDEGGELTGDLTEPKSDSTTRGETESNDLKAQNDQVNEVVSKDPGKPTDLQSGKDHADPKLDKSVDSEQGANTSVVLSSEDEQASSPTVKTTPTRKIMATPKSSTKKAEREKQREEKLRLKKEKEEQKRKEKEEKDKKKQEELRLKEEEKKRKEEERKRKEEERKRKEEERKKKEEAKEEERRKKEEEKKKKEEMKEEDRRKKEEARLAEERKENLAKAAFTKFFITEKSKPNLPKKEELEAQTEKTERSKFMPFPVKSDMRLAVQVRHTLTEEEKNALSEALASRQPVGDTYLKELKNGRKPKTGPATWPLSDEQHDVIIVESVDDDKGDIEEEAKSNGKSKGQKAKLLQFHENRRPPYWGTWRKPSKAVGPRRPFGQDKILDYEVDSDSEWEDEEEGEDIDKEDGDSDKEEADDENVGENGYVLDNTFVPHGYLSDEEADEAEDNESVETQKLKLTVLKQEFDQELKSKTQRLQPRLLGCVKIPNTTLEASKSIYQLLMKLRCKWGNEEPIDVTSPPVVECSPSPSVSNIKFPSSMVEQLAKLIHGNRASMKALISEFMNSCDKDTQLSAVSKRAVFLKVKEIAAKTYSNVSGRLVWAVHPDLCAEFGLEPIVDPPKAVPVVSPVAEPPKPKDSPLANFLKKAPTSQGPIKRISTTLIPRDGPSGTPSRGNEVVHVDTPRPKFTPQGSIVASNTNKTIRRVSTTLLSSVAGPVKNKTFNVCEIDKPGQLPIDQPKTANTVSATVDLTDSNDGITPLPDEVGQPVPPVRSASPADPPVAAACDSSAHPTVPSDPGNPPQASVKDAANTVAAGSLGSSMAGSADSASKAFEPTPMETDTPTSDAGLPPSNPAKDGIPGPAATDLANAKSSSTGPSPMETDDLPELRTEVKPTAAINDGKPPTCSADTKPPTLSSDAKLPTIPSDAKSSTITDAIPPSTSSDAKSSTITDAIPPSTSSDAKSSTITDATPPSTSSDAKSSTITDATPPSTSSDAKSSTTGLPPSNPAKDGIPGPAATDLANAKSSSTGPSPMETDDLPELRIEVKPTAAISDGKPPTFSTDTKPPTLSSDAKLPSDAKSSTITDAKPHSASSDAKPQPITKPTTVFRKTLEAAKSGASTKTPIRKRVPLVALSKSVPKTKNAKSPGHQSITDMFCRKPAKKDTPSKPPPLEPSAVVDLSDD